MTRLHQLARAEAFQRVPETCPELQATGTKVSFKLSSWIDSRFHDKLSEGERSEIAHKIGATIADLLDAAKDHGTAPLRAALVTEIENNLRLSLSPERIARIEAGEDPEASLDAQNTNA